MTRSRSNTSNLGILDSRYVNITGDTMTGALTIQPSTNTTSALVVNDKDSTNVLTVDTSNKRVGIGTASPGEKLSMAGSTGATFGLSMLPDGWVPKHRYTVPTSGNQSMLSWNWNGTARDSADFGTSGIKINDNYLTFHTGNGFTEQVRITSAGNVGIGTTAPSSKLVVSGDVQLNNAFSKLKINTEGSDYGIRLFANSYYSGETWGTRIWKDHHNGGIALHIDNQSDGTWYSSVIFGHGQQAPDPLFGVYGGAVFGSTYTGNYLPPSNGIIVEGNVGIGTTNPSYALDILGSTGIRTRGSSVANELLLNPTIDGYGVYLRTVKGSGMTAANLYLDPESGNVNIMDGSDNFSFSIYSGVTQSIKLNAAGNSWIAGGNVGIGTTAPINLLSLGGNSARTIWLERHTTANTAGNSLTIQAGGATKGMLSTVAVSAAGNGYNVSDVLTLATPTGGIEATCTVATLTGGAGSGVATVTITTKGSNYTTGVKTTTVAPAGGTGCTINVTAIESATNKAGGDLILSPGISTGSTESGVQINGCVVGVSGTSDGTITKAIQVLGNKIAFFNGTPIIQQTLAAYTSDSEGSAYTGIDNAQAGAVYATVVDLNQLRVAYETLRASYDDLKTKLQATTLIL